MRIISDFHDYYDVGMQNGIDPQLPYRRFRREENVRSEVAVPFYQIDWDYPSGYDEYQAEKFKVLFIGFAGKIYPVLEHTNTANEMIYDFDLDTIKPKYWDEYLDDHLDQDPGMKKKKPGLEERKKLIVDLKKNLKEVFALKDKKALLDLFDYFKTAIFIIRLESLKVIVNERLNQYGFQKVLPPMQAFQELEMYVGACLTKPTIEEPPIPDKVKAEIHGFDKHSFRKDKSKKKKK